MIAASLLSAVLGNDLPGPGSVYLRQELRFLRPVFPGDEICAVVTIKGVEADRGRVTLDTRVANQNGKDVVEEEEAELVMSEFLNAK